MARVFLLTGMAIALLASPVHAYVGPGIGITLVGWLAGAIAFVGAALGATLHWPLRKLFQRLRRKTPGKAAQGASGGAPEAGSTDTPTPNPKSAE
jgi:hypothetical protein